MEDKLEELKRFRKQRRRQQIWSNIKDRFSGFWMLGVGTGGEDVSKKKKQDEIVQVDDDDISNKLNSLAEIPELLTTSDDNEFADDVAPLQSDLENSKVNQVNESKTYRYTLRAVVFLFWVTLYVIAIELKFGLVFLMFSALFGIYFNTRTRPKSPNEISAYSVFNKNCQSIDGTLTAEQFERDILFRPANIK